MSSKTGDVRFATNGLIRFLPEEDSDSYKLVNGCYCHYKGTTTQFIASPDTLPRDASVTIYYMDKDTVYEVVKN